jgi:hypothetical protein
MSENTRVTLQQRRGSDFAAKLNTALAAAHRLDGELKDVTPAPAAIEHDTSLPVPVIDAIILYEWQTLLSTCISLIHKMEAKDV